MLSSMLLSLLRVSRKCQWRLDLFLNQADELQSTDEYSFSFQGQPSLVLLLEGL